MGKPLRHQRRETAGERQRLLMGETAEHDMGHDLELAAHRRRDMLMIVAVTRGPPRGDAVHQFAAVGKDDAVAAGRHHRKRFAGNLHLRIGQPDVRESVREPCRGGGMQRRIGGARSVRCRRHEVRIRLAKSAIRDESLPGL